MNLKKQLSGLFLILLTFAVYSQSGRTETLFDGGWKFFKGEVTGAEKPGYNDKSWRNIDLPHDWSIEKLENQSPGKVIGPFSKESIGTTATGYVVGGIGWYRKTFVLDPALAGSSTSLQFDGVYMDCEIWINGKYAGNHPYGYTAFQIDITGLLKNPGQPNMIAVKVKNEGKNSRWYSGSGIYRHVWLIQTQAIHFSPWGVSLNTQEITPEKAIVKISANVINNAAKAGSIRLQINARNKDGKVVATAQSPARTISAKNIEISQDLIIPKVHLWSIQDPYLYQIEVKILTDGSLSDNITISSGIRTIKVDAENGLILNGENIKLKGGCIHHDNGFLGSATIDRAEERRIELMKAYGFNAIRTSHNPPSVEFLNACDRLGMLVIDEAFDMWEKAKNPEDYHRFFRDNWQSDLESMIMRDRNHPAVIFWSIGNEINERADTSGLMIARKLIEEVRTLDPTRPVTEAICSFWDHPGRSWEATSPAFDLLDIGGYNYQWSQYENDHLKFPERVMMGTESTAREAFDNWTRVEKNPYLIGDFVWTGMDYLGETGIGNNRLNDNPDSAFCRTWPWFNSFCGDIDLCGFKKPQLLYRDILWNNSKLEMVVHQPIPEGKKEMISYWGWPDEMSSWTWNGFEGRMMEVRVFTKYPEIRLELNGKIIAQKINSDSLKYILTFQAPYQPGTLKAIGLINGIEVAEKTLTTTGKPAAIKLTADRTLLSNNRNDLSYIRIEITDQQGNTIPNASLPVRLSVTGVGELAGSGNACPFDMESFNAPVCKTYQGKALAIIRPSIAVTSGTVTLKAESEGLISGEIMIHIK